MTTVPVLPLADVALPGLLTGLLGVVIVFAVLLVLSIAMGASRRKGEAEPAPVVIQAVAPAPAAMAPAVAEPVKLIGVEDKEAAMIMAIVCDELQAPPEELYFKSIRLIDADAAQ